MEKVNKYRCTSCPHRCQYSNSIPQKVPGALLRLGDVYCDAGKKVRTFKRKDPKVYPPSWCPRLKVPSEYRIYEFKDENTWYLRQLLRHEGVKSLPLRFEYKIRVEGTTALTPQEFWRATQEKLASDILDTPIHNDEVVEIDDGLHPYFFHFTENTVIPFSHF